MRRLKIDARELPSMAQHQLIGQPRIAIYRVRAPRRDHRLLTALLPSLLMLGLAACADARGQGAAGKAEAPQTKAEAPRGESSGREVDAAEGLSVRYRFSERYAAAPDPRHPEYITDYQVGVREVYKLTQKAQTGSTVTNETQRQTIYTEQVARAGRLGEPVSILRRYDRFNFKMRDPQAEAQAANYRGMLEGLVMWLNYRPGQPPLMINLTEGRQVREAEYFSMSKLIWLPRMKGLLPPLACRVDDTWKVPIQEAAALLGYMPEAEQYDLEGRLVEVRKQADGQSLRAKMQITGQLDLPNGPSAVNAMIVFDFIPVQRSNVAQRSPTARSRDLGIVEAPGRIVELRMALVTRMVAPGDEGRVQSTVSYEIHVARRPTPPAGPNSKGPIPIPETPPQPTQANTWIRYDDPQDRFHFLHPQELQIDDKQLLPAFIPLVSSTSDMNIDFVLRSVSESAQVLLDPEHNHLKEARSGWKRSGAPVTVGPQGWLPEADWAASNRKVHRIEAGTGGKAEEPDKVRLYLDDYLVVFPSKQVLTVFAITSQDPHIPFRLMAESVIKSFELHEQKPTPPSNR